MYRFVAKTESPPPVSKTGPWRVIMIENKRYSLRRLAKRLQEKTGPGAPLEGFQISSVSWSPSAGGGSGSNFSRHLEILGVADVHITGPGTAMMYQPFLRDGAVHINTGIPSWVGQGYMEEYLAEGSPHVRALYYPRRTGRPLFEDDVFVELLQKARKLLQAGMQQPEPVGANLSPVGKVFKAFAYLRARKWFDLSTLAHHHICLREIANPPVKQGDSALFMSHFFPEDGVYCGLHRKVACTVIREQCLLPALRASFDKRFPELGPNRTGWFGTSGWFNLSKVPP